MEEKSSLKLGIWVGATTKHVIGHPQLGLYFAINISRYAKLVFLFVHIPHSCFPYKICIPACPHSLNARNAGTQEHRNAGARERKI